MIYGEHDINRHLTVFATEGHPGMLAPALMGLRVEAIRVHLSRADIERLRDLCDEALS